MNSSDGWNISLFVWLGHPPCLTFWHVAYVIETADSRWWQAFVCLSMN